VRTPDSKTAALRRVTFLHGCTNRELAKLASQVDEASVSAGTVLMREGDYGSEAFIVVEGWAAVSSAGETLAAIGPAEFIGEMAMLSGDPRSATVVAKTDMTVLVLGPTTFQTVAEHPAVGRAMSRCLARRLADTQAQM
jgi:CRP/FNR family cyclic AMP-dependent transcriptional regulator